MNKDLILREKLAIERTVMANDRTLLSFIRTALYFAVAGLTLDELLNISHAALVRTLLLGAAILVAVAGVVKYLVQLRKIRDSRKHIGNYLLDSEVATPGNTDKHLWASKLLQR